MSRGLLIHCEQSAEMVINIRAYRTASWSTRLSHVLPVNFLQTLRAGSELELRLFYAGSPLRKAESDSAPRECQAVKVPLDQSCWLRPLPLERRCSRVTGL